MTTAYTSVKDCQDFTYPALQEQIAIRLQLIREMVGSLYPSILVDEVVKLRELCREKHDTCSKI